ncbi:Alpha/Beta hydrolase protein [Dactylonectria macrodidyma]|uniref:Alpha/Beta hydrolase protein n=1 Tax=Dactylonectria macrodidyma TaxID=307937 RepID=A0A9P9DY14_9HYPO|nr:Alpha/Beta hydrolase protein [Dactylonectria macrodidyma]
MGAKIHWFNDLNCDYLILYFHGGGFGLPPNEGHPKFLIECQEKLSQKGKRVAIALLEYSLTPESQYPTQPQQALLALQQVLKKGFDPSNIVLGGDSAGGNLTLAVLSLLSHPAPPFPTVKLTAPLRGALLISPWVSFSTQSESFQSCAHRDYVNKLQVFEWADAYCPSPIRNEYSEPARAGSDWWKGLPVQEVLVLAGGMEVFHDDVKTLGTNLTAAGVKLKVIECENHTHIECILDAVAGLEPGQMAYAIWDWLDITF